MTHIFDGLIYPLLNVTEQTAIKAFKMAGNGNPKEIDEVCADIARHHLDKVPGTLYVQMSEGKKDKVKHIEQSEIFGLDKNTVVYNTEGKKEGEFSLAIDVVDGTKQCSIYGRESISALSVCTHTNMWKNSDFYVKKLAYSTYIKQRANLSLYDSPEQIVKLARGVLGRQPVITILDRERHNGLINDLRKAGAVIRLINDCDIGYAIETCIDDGKLHDIYLGIGGNSESSIVAGPIANLGGHFEIQLLQDGLPDGSPITASQLIKGESLFVASGILDGILLKGCRVKGNSIVVSSMVVSSKVIMKIEREIK